MRIGKIQRKRPVLEGGVGSDAGTTDSVVVGPSSLGVVSAITVSLGPTLDGADECGSPDAGTAPGAELASKLMFGERAAMLVADFSVSASVVDVSVSSRGLLSRAGRIFNTTLRLKASTVTGRGDSRLTTTTVIGKLLLFSPIQTLSTPFFPTAMSRSESLGETLGKSAISRSGFVANLSVGVIESERSTSTDTLSPTVAT